MDWKRALIGVGERLGWVYTGKSRPDFQQLIQRLHPERTQFPLIRLGGERDGGYLVPDDLNGVTALFSPGVAGSSEFEQDCWERGMDIFMADASVEGPASGMAGKPRVHFVKQFVGADGRSNRLSLQDWVKAAGVRDDGEWIGQIDIEGAEYELLLNAPTDLLARFRILVIEFHDVDLWSHPGMRQVVESVVDRLLVHHRVVHAHPNNYVPLKRMRGVEVPPLLESTLLRRDRSPGLGWVDQFPHPLDRDNVTVKRSVVLPRNWWGGPR